MKSVLAKVYAKTVGKTYELERERYFTAKVADEAAFLKKYSITSIFDEI